RLDRDRPLFFKARSQAARAPHARRSRGGAGTCTENYHDHHDCRDCVASYRPPPGPSMAMVCGADVGGICGGRRRGVEFLDLLRGAQAEQLCSLNDQGRGGPAGGFDGVLWNCAASALFGRGSFAHLHTACARIVLEFADRVSDRPRAGLAAARRGTLPETEPARLRGLLPCHAFPPDSMDLVIAAVMIFRP